MSGAHDSGEIHAAATDGGAPKQVRSGVKCQASSEDVCSYRTPYNGQSNSVARRHGHRRADRPDRKSISSIHWPLFLPLERDLHPLLKYKCHLPITRKSDRLHLPPEGGKVIHHCPELIARTSKFIKY